MAKSRLEDLNLSPDEEPQFAAASSDETDKWLSAIEVMRSCGSWDWADDTLRGIYDGVDASGRITEGQKKAIRNIRDARGKAAEELGLDTL